MNADPEPSSRRKFVAGVGRFAVTIPFATRLDPSPPSERSPVGPAPWPPPGTWDLSWINRLATATDRAVFDWPTLGDPTGPIVPQIAARYLDNCKDAYGADGFRAGVVLNIRTSATAAGLSDAAWERFSLGAEYNVTDPATQQPARRNPFWRRPAGTPPVPSEPMLDELVQGGAIVLVCDFALGHLAARLATKLGRTTDEVHRELRGLFIPTAIAVPSGIFGLARSQNAGCAFVRM